ncbi:DUF2157 domain-containing protein [Paenibacillus koleovorans]|uniref:DUF2157 domain-containing protein n=1 Tax=Paenibacillus koleovorans TaxID=121608 RepID=UPI000FD72F69|nr:DUF2157 domain-containing protein [Paenibacillus koleovorans]
MSRKWLEREGSRWVEQNIVTREQYTKLLSLYPDKQHAIGVLPVLGSVLVGLGLLSFIAANWQTISPLWRLLLILAVMAGLYLAGERLLRRGHDKLGIAVMGIGLLAFGGGIVLIGQTFHFVAGNSASFLVWAIAGLLLTFLYPSRYLFLLTLAIFHTAQVYSVSNFQAFSYTGAVLMTVGLGAYLYKRSDSLLTGLLGLSILFQTVLLVALKEWALMWVLVPAMALYAAGDWLQRRERLASLQTPALVAAYLIGVFLVLFVNERESSYLEEHVRANAMYYIPVVLVLFAISVYGKWKDRREISALEWLLFLPVAYFSSGADVVALVLLFLFSLYVLWRGYAEEWRFKINFGTVLFLFSTMIAYGKLTWAFMDKSLFFILGGVLLLMLSWLLNRRRRRFLDETEEG